MTTRGNQSREKAEISPAISLVPTIPNSDGKKCEKFKKNPSQKVRPVTEYRLTYERWKKSYVKPIFGTWRFSKVSKLNMMIDDNTFSACSSFKARPICTFRTDDKQPLKPLNTKARCQRLGTKETVNRAPLSPREPSSQQNARCRCSPWR